MDESNTIFPVSSQHDVSDVVKAEQVEDVGKFVNEIIQSKVSSDGETMMLSNVDQDVVPKIEGVQNHSTLKEQLQEETDEPESQNAIDLDRPKYTTSTPKKSTIIAVYAGRARPEVFAPETVTETVEISDEMSIETIELSDDSHEQRKRNGNKIDYTKMSKASINPHFFVFAGSPVTEDSNVPIAKRTRSQNTPHK